MFEKKHSKPYSVEFDPDKQKAVLKCSICNGERVAGFKNKATGHFTEVAFIKDDKDLDAFMEFYELAAITKEY